MKSYKKIGALLLMAVATISPTFAESSVEEVNNVNATKIYLPERENWFVNVAAGPQILFSDHDKQSSFGKRIAPALDIAIGKWFKNGMGVRLMYSGLSAKGATQDGTYSTGEYLGHDKGWTYIQKFNFCNVHADVMFNVTQLIKKEKLNEVWACNPYIGVGIAHIYDSPKKNCASFNMGIYNTIRIVDCLDATIDLRSMFVGDGFDGEKGHRKGEGILSFSLGLAYNF